MDPAPGGPKPCQVLPRDVSQQISYQALDAMPGKSGSRSVCAHCAPSLTSAPSPSDGPIL